MSEFLMDLDDGMTEFFRDIARYLVKESGMPYAEAVARLNAAFRDATFGPYPDIMCHEGEDYWASGVYYEPLPDGREVPWWEPDADRSAWRTRPAPPRDSPAWTLPLDAEAPPPRPELHELPPDDPRVFRMPSGEDS
ncbi:hypothetical protein [Streptomyces aidingensis]|uniref:Uncharacterized protein n=1 Tax=Streptomyces aidingensis TaxID=910347 RepID=A0A1I1I210_9ACTN|nr:hypothetical protein [Streptomyces aidingensis]SFC27723.1 hypothetical protein SAMN05421773_102531 [Streptomyces aidingensis]